MFQAATKRFIDKFYRICPACHKQLTWNGWKKHKCGQDKYSYEDEKELDQFYELDGWGG